MFKTLKLMKQAFIQEWGKDYEKVPFIYNQRSLIGGRIERQYIKYKWVKKQPK